MLQIVHDLAPDAQLFFATADVSEAGFAATSRLSATRRTTATSSSTTSSTSTSRSSRTGSSRRPSTRSRTRRRRSTSPPRRQRGQRPRRARPATSRGDFNDAGIPGLYVPRRHQVGDDPQLRPASTATSSPRPGSRYTLNWSDPAGASGNDYDLFLVSSTGTVRRPPRTSRAGRQNPYEFISAPALVAGDRLVVFKTAAARPSRLQPQHAARPPDPRHDGADARPLLRRKPRSSVAAAPAVSPGPYPAAFAQSSPAESFTSDGPRRVFYDARRARR